MIQKRFPADISLNISTFLNDSSIDGELYSIYQSLSMPYEQQDGTFITKVKKKDIPKQAALCQLLGIKSPKTIRAHHQALIDKGYVILDNEDYVLPQVENIYLMIPLETLRFLNNNCKRHVIKIYIYLGQKYKNQGKNCMFTAIELGEHIGIQVKNKVHGYEIINDALDLLEDCGLIHYTTVTDGVKQKKKLENFSLTRPRG